MTTLALSPAGAAAWPRHLGALVIVAAVLLALFSADLGDMAAIWWTNTTFGHCLFIGPVVAWLVWQRRAELARLEPVAWMPGLLLVTVGGAGWLLGDAASVAFARQLGLVVMLQGAVVTLLGPRVARGLLFPLGYALFAVPFGQELEPPLQAVTVAIVMPLLDLLGLPATSNGVLIHAGRYWFEVAEACSGSKFVLAMAAFSTLVAATCFRTWQRRAMFMATALVIPVIANGVRAAATIYAADLWGIERATGVDHIVFGWVFFGLVMAGVLALGWRWFDRAPDAPAFDPERLSGRPEHTLALPPAAVLVVALAAAFPAWSATTASRTATLPARMVLPDVPGWTRVPIDARTGWRPFYPAADHMLIGRYGNGRDQVDVAIAAFARQREGAELIAFGTGVLRQNDRWVRMADEPPLAGGETMRIVAPGPVERIVATWYRVGGTTARSGMRVKLVTMKARLIGGDQAALALHVSAIGADARGAMARFLAAAGQPDRIVDNAAGR